MEATTWKMKCADCGKKNIPDPEHMQREDIVCARCESKVESDIERRKGILKAVY